METDHQKSNPGSGKRWTINVDDDDDDDYGHKIYGYKILKFHKKSFPAVEE